jgi:hypothetical protein
MPRTTCSDAGKNLAACRWRKHNKKKARGKFQVEKAANQAKKAVKAAKVKKLQAAALKQKSKLPKKKIPKKKKKMKKGKIYTSDVFD